MQCSKPGLACCHCAAVRQAPAPWASGRQGADTPQRDAGTPQRGLRDAAVGVPQDSWELLRRVPRVLRVLRQASGQGVLRDSWELVRRVLRVLRVLRQAFGRGGHRGPWQVGGAAVGVHCCAAGGGPSCWAPACAGGPGLAGPVGAGRALPGCLPLALPSPAEKWAAAELSGALGSVGLGCRSSSLSASSLSGWGGGRAQVQLQV